MGRKKGKSLPEMGYELRKVVIYRAAVTPINTFKSMDYVTRSRKFATDHAKHVAAVEEEDANVLKALVNASDVYEAYNPGEYFYDGPEIVGRIIKVIPAFKPNPTPPPPRPVIQGCCACEPSPTLRHQWEKRRHLIAIRGTFCKHCLLPYSVWEKMLRPNPDERLRKLERQYQSSPTEELRSKLNVLRNRAGLKLIPPVCRVFEYGEGWQVQSILDITISTATASHDGWMGIDHVWFTDEMELPSSLGSHIFSRGYGQELPKPSRQQVIQAHLEVTGIFERESFGAMSHFLASHPAFPDGHECDFSMYDLSESPLREFALCYTCTEPGRIYCDEHQLSMCAYHATLCEEADCTNLECPQCAPKCDVCEQPACSYHIRECTCGHDACTNAGQHCWDHCEDCGDRICKLCATIMDGDWYCEEHAP